ncbi:MMPL family transporter [Streptomyces sp. ID05-04B]|uniref:MMPL family transporter n=1 Tax=Streptomyces sp. ID05-04B TaxID=3028661 RepID=UPI0029C4AE05|nr:MMPL family transporter [Streptomyces sp. ID05-04B]MDX5565688.1 MMPL family transporter [Streptomyces sp. ID05-04B]
MAAPVADLRLGLGGETDPQSSAGRAQALVDEGFGPGCSGTLVVLAQGENKASVRAAATDIAAQLKNLPEMSSASPAIPASSGDVAVIDVMPAGGPESEGTKSLLSEIREIRGDVEQRADTTLNVTGETAVNIDVADKLSAALPLYRLLVMGLALVLLVIVFRSIAVPLKAALDFMLSVGSSLGAVVAVLQWGWPPSATRRGGCPGLCSVWCPRWTSKANASPSCTPRLTGPSRSFLRSPRRWKPAAPSPWSDGACRTGTFPPVRPRSR